MEITTSSRRRTRSQPHRCLELPEVLATILSLLGEDTLYRVTPLVSRLWLEHSRNLKPVCIAVVWHSSWSSELLDMKLLALQDDAVYFRCYITHPNIEQEYKGRMLYRVLNNLQTKIREQEQACYSEDQNYDDTLNLFKTGRNGKPFGTLRSLHLHFGPLALSAAVNAFPFPTSLSNLSIVGVRSDQPLDLSRIVDRCPFLEELYIEGHATTWATACLIWNYQNQRCFNRLRALTLKSVHILLNGLNCLFSTSPKLFDVMIVGVSTDQDGELQDGIYRALKTLPMASRSASLLPFSGVMPKEELRRWLERTWYAWLDLSLYVPSTTLSLLRGVVNCSSLLTSLELVPHTRIVLSPLPRGTLSDQNSVYRRLHTYLCTSSKLVHLKHLRTAIILEDIDLFGRRWFVDSDIGVNEAQYPRNDESTTHMGIWLCRRLKSLRVEIHNGMESLRTSSVHSRIVFGYISRVCPYLESLEIDVPFSDATAMPRDTSFYPQLSMKLEGGLCLLAKLDRLRRLRISSEHGRWTFDCEDYELNWISCSPYHRMNRMFRHWKMSRWKKMREHEKQQEESRLRFRVDDTMASVTKTTELEAVDLIDNAMNIVTGAVTQECHIGAGNEGYMAGEINHYPSNRLESWFSAMGLEDNTEQGEEDIEDDEWVEDNTGVEEDEDIILFPPIDLGDSMMAPQTATAGQDTPDNQTTTSYVVLDTEVDDNDGEGTEDDELFAPETPPATCLVGVQQVVGDLQNLGLLHDVEVMIRWMQSDSFRPLPVLNRLSLGFEALQRPKDEMRRLFPRSIEP